MISKFFRQLRQIPKLLQQKKNWLNDQQPAYVLLLSLDLLYLYQCQNSPSNIVFPSYHTDISVSFYAVICYSVPIYINKMHTYIHYFVLYDDIISLVFTLHTCLEKNLVDFFEILTDFQQFSNSCNGLVYSKPAK